MINYFNYKPYGNHEVLITNDYGRYMFLEKKSFAKLLSDEMHPNDAEFEQLEHNGFITNGHTERYFLDFQEQYRMAKRYLFNGPDLHIFVVTTQCNARCCYCQASASNKKHGNMTKEVARSAVDIALKSPEDYLTFEFQGGEPLVNFGIIKYIHDYAETNKGSKILNYTIVTNLSLMNEEIEDYLLDNNFTVSTSIDGNEELHNLNRPMISGENGFKQAAKWMRSLQEKGIQVGAIQTTTRASLNQPNNIIDTYVELGVKQLFVRPLTPLGFAKESWNDIGYTAEKFIEFYEKCLDYIIELNKEGVALCENHAKYFLGKIMHGMGSGYTELRSPCGAAFAQMAYYYNGDIYTCDEGRMLGEMGDKAFMIGTVHDQYDELMTNPICQAVSAASTLESIPYCSDCVYNPYCGTCPVINYALYNDIFPNHSNNYKCKIYKGLLDKLFSILHDGNEETIDILKSW